MQRKEARIMTQKYEAGTYIRYGGAGICLIDRLEEVPYPGAEPMMRLCYVLKPVRNACMEVSVPLDNETLCGKMQPLRTKAEIEQMLETSGQDDIPLWTEDRKLRAAEFRQVLAGGEASELLRMIRCILRQRALLLKSGRHLNAADDNARRDAVRMLEEEFAFSLGTTAEEAGRWIRAVLKREFM